MRFLFIDPIGDKESTDLNIGIAYCASAAIEQGHLISVVDLVNTMPPDPLAAIKTAVENFQPDAVGISITNMSFNTSKGYVDDIKRYFKGMVVLGGPEITALAARSLELMPNADIAVIGEGEITLVELLAAIGKNASLESVNGLVWRKSNNIITNPPRPFIADLDKVLFPNYDVFGVSAMDLYPIVTSRGCPYGCIFCFSHLGKKWRARTAENIIEELKIAKNKYGARNHCISLWCNP